MEESEKIELIQCPKCKGIKDETLGVCSVCNGSGKLALKKIGRRKRHEEPARDWTEELKRRGLWDVNN